MPSVPKELVQSGPPEPCESLHALRGWVRRHLGINFGGGLESIFSDRISVVCRSLDTTPDDLLAALDAGDQRITLRVCEAVSTNYTFFFREPQAFKLLAEEILPSLPPGPLRLWSAAASSGEEAFSVAITTCQAFGSEVARQRVRILGTDLSARQVQLAEAATYTRSQIGVDAWPSVAPWAVSAGIGQVQMVSELRSMCTFRRMNLTQRARWPFEQRFHVIFLRNVLYYFEPETQRSILEACADACEPGGWLVTSLTEPLAEITRPWRQVHAAIYRRGS